MGDMRPHNLKPLALLVISDLMLSLSEAGNDLGI